MITNMIATLVAWTRRAFVNAKAAEVERDLVRCGEHGLTRPAFVCQHLARSLIGGSDKRGFFKPDRPPVDADPHAWCAECDAVLRRVGSWNDESEAAAGITLICSGCYERAERLNSNGVGAM